MTVLGNTAAHRQAHSGKSGGRGGHVTKGTDWHWPRGLPRKEETTGHGSHQMNLRRQFPPPRAGGAGEGREGCPHLALCHLISWHRLSSPLFLEPLSLFPQTSPTTEAQDLKEARGIVTTGAGQGREDSPRTQCSDLKELPAQQGDSAWALTTSDLLQYLLLALHRPRDGHCS